jgi:hypothetical protein
MVRGWDMLCCDLSQFVAILRKPSDSALILIRKISTFPGAAIPPQARFHLNVSISVIQPKG